jgi:hypothetical protein
VVTWSVPRALYTLLRGSLTVAVADSISRQVGRDCPRQRPLKVAYHSQNIKKQIYSSVSVLLLLSAQIESAAPSRSQPAGHIQCASHGFVSIRLTCSF